MILIAMSILFYLTNSKKNIEIYRKDLGRVRREAEIKWRAGTGWCLYQSKTRRRLYGTASRIKSPSIPSTLRSTEYPFFFFFISLNRQDLTIFYFLFFLSIIHSHFLSFHYCTVQYSQSPCWNPRFASLPQRRSLKGHYTLCIFNFESQLLFVSVNYLFQCSRFCDFIEC